MSTQAASTRPANRSMQEVPNRPMDPAQTRAMQEAQTHPMAAMPDGHRQPAMSPGTETKQAFATTEFWVYVAAVVGVLAASQLVGQNAAGVDIFRAPQAWFFITLLTIGYLGSRGLAKAGSNFRSGRERKARH
ncbi:hypothetical protein AWW66_29960 [Micromonospora rosaria]|uniref:Uncharacterized protein n=1 Tax=Micromonospora rosaria TaxID=47874 RepID=A0A136PJ13_9ACTN|nr:hypothetical protein [Micromonospora rosaria]KXK58405.1 hypothetical protein AWW66_29960 [Micromonospora rosaria]